MRSGSSITQIIVSIQHSKTRKAFLHLASRVFGVKDGSISQALQKRKHFLRSSVEPRLASLGQLRNSRAEHYRALRSFTQPSSASFSPAANSPLGWHSAPTLSNVNVSHYQLCRSPSSREYITRIAETQALFTLPRRTPSCPNPVCTLLISSSILS